MGTCNLSFSTYKYADNSILGEYLAKQVAMESNQLMMRDRNNNQVCDTDTKKLSLNLDRTRMTYSNTENDVDIYCNMQERILTCFGYLKDGSNGIRYEASETLGEKLTERLCLKDKCSTSQNLNLINVYPSEERIYTGYNTYKIENGKELYLNKFINGRINNIEFTEPHYPEAPTTKAVLHEVPAASVKAQEEIITDNLRPSLNSNQTTNGNSFYDNVDSVVSFSLNVAGGVGLGLTSAYCVYRTIQTAKKFFSEYSNPKLSTEDKIKGAAPAILWSIGSLATTVSCAFIATRLT